MEEYGIVDKLILFGLTRQEASVYICLLKCGELTGYEVAKETGISRSNVYSTLSSLVNHGAAYLKEASSSKYVAVPVGEFCENHIYRLEKEKKYLIENMPGRKESIEGYITIEGYRNVMNKIHHMILGTEYRVYFSATALFLLHFKNELKELSDKGLKVVLITDEMCEEWEREDMIVYLSDVQKNNQIRLIVDSSQVLTGEINGRENDNCLYCAQPNFVNVFKEALSNEIKLIELKGKQT